MTLIKTIDARFQWGTEHTEGSVHITAEEWAELKESLSAQSEYRRLLKMIAYPRRGQMEESMTLQDFADAIQESFPLWVLEGEEGNV